jgi:hypothetical protein
MEYFEDAMDHRIDYRLFTAELFEKRFPGFPEETYEYMADRANTKYYKSEMLDELLVKVLFPKYKLNR